MCLWPATRMNDKLVKDITFHRHDPHKAYMSVVRNHRAHLC